MFYKHVSFAYDFEVFLLFKSLNIFIGPLKAHRLCLVATSSLEGLRPQTEQEGQVYAWNLSSGYVLQCEDPSIRNTFPAGLPTTGHSTTGKDENISTLRQPPMCK